MEHEASGISDVSSFSLDVLFLLWIPKEKTHKICNTVTDHLPSSSLNSTEDGNFTENHCEINDFENSKY